MTYIIRATHQTARLRRLRESLVAYLAVCLCGVATAADPLPSWNNGPTKSSIINFVENVITKGSPHFVAPAERIATFDNDGCLWSEKPYYFQLAFAIDRVKATAEQHPEWKTEQHTVIQKFKDE